MGIPSVSCTQDPDWLETAVETMRTFGLVAVLDVADAEFLSRTREALYRARDGILADIGKERLERAGELGVVRLAMKYDNWLLKVLELPAVLQMVDAALAPNAILHLQNGLILPSFAADQPRVFQNRFHQDFPRVLNGHLMSINLMFAVDEFREDNGATLFIPGSHQRSDLQLAAVERTAVNALCPAGSMILFDSTTWHAAGANSSGRDRLAMNHQFTRSYVKQQVDYVRALGDEVVLRQPPRTQQLLGWYTRVVTSLDEYYRPSQDRLYRSGQG
ncbi:MAG: phytanoyl-CoA dioxygenase family protein [Candidatus Dormibacteraceae bacterium]